MTFREKIQNFIDEEKLIQKDDRILIGFSGGPDSMVLLHLLYGLQKQYNLMLAIVHLNHALRGKDADRDEQFARNYARDLGLPFFSTKIYIQNMAQKDHLSLEEAGRNARMELFERITSQLYFHKIALGHHADDQAETVVMNLVRGSGLRGLSGMQPQRDRVIRPLLVVSREEIGRYADQERLPFVNDTSNKSENFLRNRIRWNLLKQIENAFGFKGSYGICRSADNIREIQNYMSSIAKEAIESSILEKRPNEIILDIDEFLSYFKAVQKMVLLQIFSEMIPHRRLHSCEINGVFKLLQNGGSGKRYEMGKDLSIIRSQNTVSFQKESTTLDLIPIEIGKKIEIPALGMHFKSQQIKKQKFDYKTNPLTEVIDLEKIQEPLFIRSTKSGDFFYPLGMRKKKKLHDFFIDEKIPQYKRRQIPLFISNDKIVWIMGYRLDNRFKVTNNTRQHLKLTISKLKSTKVE